MKVERHGKIVAKNKISDGRKKLDELKQSGEDNIDSLRKQLSDLVGPDDKR